MSALAGTIAAPLPARRGGLGAAGWLRATLSLLVAIGILAVAMPVAFGSRGASGGVNPVRIFSSGPLIAAESSGGGQLSVAGIVPGQSRSSMVQISNVGASSAGFTLAVHLVDRAGPGGARLSDAMTLRIQPAAGGAPLYAGSLGRMPRLELGRIPAGAQRAYRFVVALPGSVGNEVEGSSLSAGFAWNAA